MSSIDIENVAVACPDVKIASVAGVFHPRYQQLRVRKRPIRIWQFYQVFLCIRA